MVVLEGLTSEGLMSSYSGISIILQPVCNLVKCPTFFAKVGYGLVKELLVIGVSLGMEV